MESMFYRVSYSKKKDAFSTWIYVGPKKNPTWEDFGLEIECPCFRAFIEETGQPDKEKNMVHYHIITAIRQAMRLGYTVQFMDRPEENK